MKTTLLFLATNIMICNIANAALCPENFLNELYYTLKPEIIELTWLDINPRISINLCEFNIRYYPCNTNIQNQLDELLPKMIENNSSYCTLQNQGIHKQTQGYCTLEKVIVNCELGIRS